MAITNDQVAAKQFNNWRVQAGLPWALWDNYAMPGKNGPVKVETPLGKSLVAGVANLGELFRNPGGISPTISQAIAPYLANQSQDIARSYAGMGQNAAGAMGRAGLGSSPFAAALEASISNAANRAQGQARNEAMGKSEQLRRQDMDQLLNTYKLMADMIQGYRGSLLQKSQLALGQQAQGFNQSSQQQSGWMAMLGTALKAYAAYQTGGASLIAQQAGSSSTSKPWWETY